MSAPVVISASPGNASTGIVLGTTIVVAFDQLMETSTINSTTFSLTGPGQTSIITPGDLISATPNLRNGREYINGTFAFTTGTYNDASNTILTFTPATPLRPNVTYEILMIGPGALTSASMTNTSGQQLASVYKWKFTTGDLNFLIPPAQSPLTPVSVPMDPSQIRVQQKIYAVGNNLSQVITIVFPGDIDTTTVTAEQILLSLEPILGDPFVQVPEGLTPTVTITGNTITIQINGWSES